MREFSVRGSQVGITIAATISGCIGVVACDALIIGDRHVEGECTPGAKRCGGNTPEACDSTLHWDGGTRCDVDAGEHCSGGACVVTCTTGDLRCADNYTPQICDKNGDWQGAGSCGSCQPCDVNTGECRGSSLPDDSPCQDPKNKCILNGTCQNGKCISAPGGDQIECVAAGSCSPGACDPKTGICAATDGTSCHDGDACTASSSCQAGTCTSTPPSDHAWAHWDLRSPPPLPRYVWTSDVVFDKVTGLTWQRVLPKGFYLPDAANSYCACLNDSNDNTCEKIKGYLSGWRLPTRIELASIVDYSRYDPAIDSTAFPDTPSGSLFLSSSYFPGGDPITLAWAVNFFDGNVLFNGMEQAGRVRCVR
jgi:hypothetical protein